MVSIRGKIMPFARAPAHHRHDFVVVQPLSTTMLILSRSPAAFAAAMPTSTWSSLPRRVDHSETRRIEAVQARH